MDFAGNGRFNGDGFGEIVGPRKSSCTELGDPIGYREKSRFGYFCKQIGIHSQDRI